MFDKLPRREREILEIVYALNESSAAAIRQAMEDPLSDSATRALLSRLEAKNLVRHRTQDNRYIYSPVLPQKAVGASALRKLVRTFFANSPVHAASALLGLSDEITAEELIELEQVIQAARKRAK